jgi:hypothetical protein
MTGTKTPQGGASLDGQRRPPEHRPSSSGVKNKETAARAEKEEGSDYGFP